MEHEKKKSSPKSIYFSRRNINAARSEEQKIHQQNKGRAKKFLKKIYRDEKIIIIIKWNFGETIEMI